MKWKQTGKTEMFLGRDLCWGEGLGANVDNYKETDRLKTPVMLH